MPPVNVLIHLHGMTLATEAGDHTESYDKVWKKLTDREPSLKQIRSRILLEWGHIRSSDAVSSPKLDEFVTDAENYLVNRSSEAHVKRDRSPHQHRPSFVQSLLELPSWVLLRRVTTPIKDRVMLLGFTDALYYCSPDGERAVRRTIYTQLLKGLDAYRAEDEVLLHILAESLGVTVAFDFLFGLFAPDAEYPPDGKPGFICENEQFMSDDPGLRRAVDSYIFWRRAQDGHGLRLGSKSSVGGQLPLMMMRKQKLVEKLTQQEQLDPSVIGVPDVGPVKWKLSYDVDDMLGFPTRRLFMGTGTIEEYQVNAGLRPDHAHGGYWNNATVLREVAQLIKQDLG